MTASLPNLPDPSDPHYNYDDLDRNCGCSLCRVHREADTRYREIVGDTLDLDWKDSSERGRKRRKAHTALLAAAARRDLYSELSFLTHGKRDSEEFMTWVQTRLTARGDGWWANEGAKIPMEVWIEEWAIHTGRLPAPEVQDATLSTPTQ